MTKTFLFITRFPLLLLRVIRVTGGGPCETQGLYLVPKLRNTTITAATTTSTTATTTTTITTTTTTGDHRAVPGGGPQRKSHVSIKSQS